MVETIVSWNSDFQSLFSARHHRCAPTADVTSSEHCETHAVYTCQICNWYNRIYSFFKKTLDSHISVILWLSYIHSAYIHSWHDVIYEKSKTIHHSSSPHDVSLSSPCMFGKHRLNFRCMTPWRFIRNGNCWCALKQYSLVCFADFFPQFFIKV